MTSALMLDIERTRSGYVPSLLRVNLSYSCRTHPAAHYKLARNNLMIQRYNLR